MLTNSWTVLLFDNRLKLLWESTVRYAEDDLRTALQKILLLFPYLRNTGSLSPKNFIIVKPHCWWCQHQYGWVTLVLLLLLLACLENNQHKRRT